ncbi:hypothetical protein GH714_031244 [Hevea brasiliensis]|uniref:Tyrosine-protein phosphatase domain-containing protein n=1 Tax=Hevea brasiliensis TaxID=3981 RepID=A0A6A6K7S4_HEVBR|nr:hypothetical protein GH714_031244 [Hevea brasiliensis]
MRKRERENPCGVCGHYHKYEEGEICGICGHRLPESAEKIPLHVSAFPSEILPEFLYLGSYDNASRSELLKTQRISRVLNYRLVKISTRILSLIIASKMTKLYNLMMQINFRSPAIVIAYLMKSKGWTLAQSFQWVKERRPSVDLTQAVYQQLQEYEQKTFGSSDGNNPALPVFPHAGVPSLSFGFPKVNDPVPGAAFNSISTTSFLTRPLHVPPEYQFGAGHPQHSLSESPFTASPQNPNGGDISMDS